MNAARPDANPGEPRPPRLWVVGVAYRTPDVAQEFIARWSAQAPVSRVDVIECVDGAGAPAPDDPARRWHAIPNGGYGNALNAALDIVRSASAAEWDLLLAGNVDVFPVALPPVRFGDREIPMLHVQEGARERNPFLTRLQSRLLWTMGLPIRFDSIPLLRATVALNKVVGLVPSAPWTCHGSMFCFTRRLVEACGHPFNRRSLLYCEEEFYGRALEQLGFRLAPSPLRVEHVGGVSTGATRRDRRRFFEYWKQSAAEFLDRSAGAPP